MLKIKTFDRNKYNTQDFKTYYRPKLLNNEPNLRIFINDDLSEEDFRFISNSSVSNPLDTIYLEGIRIDPNSIQILSTINVKKLQLCACSILNEDAQILLSNPNIKKLSLCQNDITAIPNMPNTNLTSLDLSENYIDNETITLLLKSKLKSLDISFEYINKDHFISEMSNTKIRRIDLRQQWMFYDPRLLDVVIKNKNIICLKDARTFRSLGGMYRRLYDIVIHNYGQYLNKKIKKKTLLDFMISIL